ncbi:Cyclin, C-terminal domain [Dillenia turbinata]|uniref:Cyclin, C-terminal domain n=1 Tax=Dillenia turbinata TaxID=194707 RepID=A0AAN8VH26_9MAGN
MTSSYFFASCTLRSRASSCNCPCILEAVAVEEDGADVYILLNDSIRNILPFFTPPNASHHKAIVSADGPNEKKVERNVDGAKAAAIPKNLQKRVPPKPKPKPENVIVISSDTEKEEDIKKESKPSKSKKKIQSLTSVLTARSKVACRLTNKPKEDIVDIDSTDFNELAIVKYVEDMVRRREPQLVGMSAMLIASKYEEFWPPELENLVYFYAELGIMNYSTSIVYCPSMLAASVVYAIRCTLSKVPAWSETLRLHTRFSEPQLIDCKSEMSLSN